MAQRAGQKKPVRSRTAAETPKKSPERAEEKPSRSELEETVAELQAAKSSLLARIAEFQRSQTAAMAEHYFRKAVEESISLGIVAFGLDGRQIYVNPTFCRMVGWSREGLIGAKPPFVYWPLEEIGRYSKDFRSIISREGPAESLEVVFQRKNGERFNALLFYSSLKDGHGRLIGWVASVGDITEQKLDERRLQESEKAAKRLAGEMAIIAGMGRIIGSTLNIDEVYEQFAEEARKLIPFDRININTINSEEGTATKAYTAGPGMLGRRPGEVFPLAGSATEEVMRTRRGFLFLPRKKKEVEGRFPMLLPSFQAGHRSMMAVPLMSKDRVIGSLHFESARPRAFTDQDLELAENIGAQIAGAIANAQLFSDRVRVEEALKESGRRLKQVSSQLLLAEENERKRVTREIHDGIGQLLATVKFRMEASSGQSEEGEKRKDPSENILPLIQECIDEARRIQLNLRPSMLDDLGLLPTIGWLCRVFRTTYPAVQVETEIDLGEERVPDVLKTVIYRISQEALNNVSKHSRATLVLISLREIDGRIDLTIRDNGVGFRLQEPPSAEGSIHGLGLSSMTERAEMFGGCCSIESAVGKGTFIHASWPVDH